MHSIVESLQRHAYEEREWNAHISILIIILWAFSLLISVPSIKMDLKKKKKNLIQALLNGSQYLLFFLYLIYSDIHYIGYMERNRVYALKAFISSCTLINCIVLIQELNNFMKWKLDVEKINSMTFKNFSLWLKLLWTLLI